MVFSIGMERVVTIQVKLERLPIDARTSVVESLADVGRKNELVSHVRCIPGSGYANVSFTTSDARALWAQIRVLVR